MSGTWSASQWAGRRGIGWRWRVGRVLARRLGRRGGGGRRGRVDRGLARRFGRRGGWRCPPGVSVGVVPASRWAGGSGLRWRVRRGVARRHGWRGGRCAGRLGLRSGRGVCGRVGGRVWAYRSGRRSRCCRRCGRGCLRSICRNAGRAGPDGVAVGEMRGDAGAATVMV